MPLFAPAAHGSFVDFADRHSRSLGPWSRRSGSFAPLFAAFAQGHFLYNERGGQLHFDRLSIRCRGCERSFVPLCCVPCRAARSGTGTWRGAMLERPASAPSPLSVGCGRPRGRARGLSERLARTTVMAARGAARWQLPVDPVLAWLVQHIGAAGHPGRPRWRMKRVGVPVLRGPTLSFV